MFLPKNPSESKAAFLARAALELEAVYTKFAAQTGYIDYHRKQYSSEERRGEHCLAGYWIGALTRTAIPSITFSVAINIKTPRNRIVPELCRAHAESQILKVRDLVRLSLLPRGVKYSIPNLL